MWLQPGLHHAGYGGIWVMAGRSLPSEKRWASLPPAPSLSIVWGAGGARFEHAAGTTDLRPGQAVWMEAGVGHRGIGLKGSDFITLFMPALTLASDPPTPQLADIGPDLVRPVLEVACAALLPGCRPLTTQVFPALHGFAAGQRAQVRPNRAVRGLQRARTVLEASENRRVTLHDLAHAAGKSTYYLSRTFAAAWGMPPSQYAKQRRLWDATCLLLDGRTVTESALRAGFSDTAHLSRTFRAQYGVSPSAWQAGVRSNRAGPSSP